MTDQGDKVFVEEDVWGVANKDRQKKKEDSGKRTMRVYKDSSGSGSGSGSGSVSVSSSAWHIPAAPREILKANTTLSPSNSSSSAPMDIPDWSKIYGKNKGSRGYEDYGNGVDEDEYDDDGNMIPPHEWLARKLARSQISSFSMCEGLGRTLKGRDLSKVRNAILTKTGFIE